VESKGTTFVPRQSSTPVPSAQPHRVITRNLRYNNLKENKKKKNKEEKRRGYV